VIIKQDKNAARRKRARRTADLHGTAKKPRLSVYRSTGHIYAQLVDDDKGVTLIAVNSLQKDIEKLAEGKTKKEIAKIVGEQAGKAALAKKIKEVIFDRNGYVYHGRIKEVAEGARAAGLKF